MEGYFEAEASIIEFAWPLLLVRGAEIGFDLYAVYKIASFGSEEQAAATLISAACTLLRGVFAVWFYPAAARISGLVEASGDPQQARKSYWSNMSLTVLATTVVMVVAKFVGPVLKACGQKDAYADIAQDFFDKYYWSFLPTFVFVLHQQIAQGLYAKDDTASTRLLLGLAAVNRFILWLLTKYSSNVSGVGKAYVVAYWVSAVLYFFAMQKMCPMLACPCVSFSEIKTTFQNGFIFFLYALAELGSVVFIVVRLGAINDDKNWLASALPAIQFFSLMANLYLQHGQAASIVLAKNRKQARDIGYAVASTNVIVALIFLGISFIPGALNTLFLTNDSDLGLARWLLVARMTGGLGDSIKNGLFSSFFKVLGSQDNYSDQPAARNAPMLQNILGIGVGMLMAYTLEKAADYAGYGVMWGMSIGIWLGAIWNVWTYWVHSSDAGESDSVRDLTFKGAVVPCLKRAHSGYQGL